MEEKKHVSFPILIQTKKTTMLLSCCFVVVFQKKIYLCQKGGRSAPSNVLILDSATSRASLNSPNSMLLISSLASMKKSAHNRGNNKLKGWNLEMGIHTIYLYAYTHVSCHMYTIGCIIDM